MICSCDRCMGYAEPDEEKPVDYCEGCGADLYEDEVYYPMLGVCEHCLHEFEKRAARND